MVDFNTKNMHSVWSIPTLDVHIELLKDNEAILERFELGS